MSDTLTSTSAQLSRVHYCTTPWVALPALTFFFFNATTTTEIYTLSLHDALPISGREACASASHGDTGLRRECERAVRCLDRKSTRLNSSHITISYAVFCLKKKKTKLALEYILQDSHN